MWGNDLFVSAFSTRRFRPALLAGAFLLGGCLEGGKDAPETTGPVTDADLPPLFAAEDAAGIPTRGLLEERRARLADVVEATAGDASVQAGTRRFVFNLFDDMRLVAEVERSETLEPGRFTLSGTLVGVAGSWFTVAMTDGALSATVHHPSLGYFEIEPEGEGLGRIAEYAPGRLPNPYHGMVYPDGTEHIHHDHGAAPQALAKAAAGPSVIDILIVYTQAAVNGAGGLANLKSRIDKSVADANLAFVNSRIDAQLRLVHTAQVTYTESGNMSTDLGRLQKKGDGYMDDAHALRETHKADLVSLVVEQAGGVAGVGYVMTSVSPWFKDYGFTVVGRPYTGSYNTLAHEVGHNLGCAHDRKNSSSPGAYPYSYGHRFYVGTAQYRDIMAYAPGTPIPYFSNPNVLYQGVPTGVPDGQATSADNARTINQTAPVASAFYAGIVVPPPGETAWAGADVGAPSLAGGHAATATGFTVTGAGADIWGTGDQFRFVYKPLNGDGEITARVSSLQNTDGWAKAGVMIRENLTAGARHAFTAVTPTSGLAFQRRVDANGHSEHTGVAGAAPRWVRIRRAGSAFTSSVSADGTTWTQVGTATIAMGTAAFIGIAVTSHNASALSTAAFESVSLR